MKKLIIVLVIFFAGHYFGNIVIGASKSAYRVVAAEYQQATKWDWMFETFVMIGLWLAILGVACLYDEFKKQYCKPSPKKDKKPVDKEPNIWDNMGVK